MAFLELNQVSKGYHSNTGYTPVLKGVNCRIEEGEFVVFVGYSGTGKTTLMSLIAGLIPPDMGSILLNHTPISGPSPERALVFQNYSLLPWLTVYENIALAVNQVFPHWSKSQRTSHIHHYIQMVNLSQASSKKPKELSGGMRQRVAVARALAMSPNVLLLDEPLSALDALTRANLQDEISRIWQDNQKTVIWVTNDVDEGLLLADRIIPLTAEPPATLGPEFVVDLPRPRDRKNLNQIERYRELRGEILHYLIQSKKTTTSFTKKLNLPDILPEDLTIPPSWFTPKRAPKRKSQVQEEPLVHS